MYKEKLIEFLPIIRTEILKKGKRLSAAQEYVLNEFAKWLAKHPLPQELRTLDVKYSCAKCGYAEDAHPVPGCQVFIVRPNPNR